MMYHILNGDALTPTFDQTGVGGQKIICRECLIEGPVEGDTPEELFSRRAAFLTPGQEQGYMKHVAAEFEKIRALPAEAEVCLWFEDDLFCQANLWFMIHLLSTKRPVIYRVFPVIPPGDDHWKGFGNPDPGLLEKAYQSKVLFSEKDVALGVALWHAYQHNDLKKLSELAQSPSSCFHYLPEVVKAHRERFPEDGSPGRPEKTIRNIMDKQTLPFSMVFSSFYKQEGIYGFGDTQLKPIYDRVLQELN